MIILITHISEYGKSADEITFFTLNVKLAADFDRNVPTKEKRLMNKSELIDVMACKSGLTKKDSEKALAAFEEGIKEELAKGGKVQLVGFGTFDVAERAAREGRNPQTGGPLKIAASKAPRFRSGKDLKDAVNNK